MADIERLDPSKRLDRIAARADQLEKTRDKMMDLVKPTSLTGKARVFVSRFVPVLRDQIMFSPIEAIKAELRGSAIELYQDLKPLLKEGKARLDHDNQVRQLMSEFEKDMDNKEVEEKLRDLIRGKAEQDLNIIKDDETEELLSELLQSQSPEVVQRRKEELLEAAKQRVVLSQPILRVTEASMIGTARLYESTVDAYGMALEFGPALNALHRNSGHIIDAAKANRQTPEIIIKQLELAAETARLAIHSAELGYKLDHTKDIAKLRLIEAQAVETLKSLPAGREQDGKTS